MSGTGRSLDRLLLVEWEDPPSTLLDVAVVVVYRDGTHDRIDEEYLSIVPAGVVVEGYPLRAGKQVRQVEVDYNESLGPVTQLAGFLRRLPEEAGKTAEAYREWRKRRRNR
jgi:hypothetical protein